MHKKSSCFICILAMLAVLLPAVAEDYQNATANAVQATKALRIGFEKTKAVNDLDVYGSRALHDIEAYSHAESTFNISQRMGMVGKISYNTDIYKPIYNVSEYSRTKPAYEVPGSLSSRPVYNIAGYPLIKVPSSIP